MQGTQRQESKHKTKQEMKPKQTNQPTKQTNDPI